MNASPRRRRGKPYDPSKLVHDRRSTDLLRNAVVAPIEIDDPYEAGAKIMTLRSLRNDPLAGMHARKHIDDAQYWGGRAFQRDFEAAERGPRAIDPGKEAVDGGATPEPITEQQREAARRLAEAHRELGADGSAVMHDFLIMGLAVTAISARRGFAGRTWEEYFGLHVRRHLHVLAFVYGFAKERSGQQRTITKN